MLGSVVLIASLIMSSVIDDACLEANSISLVRVSFPAKSDFVEDRQTSLLLGPLEKNMF